MKKLFKASLLTIGLGIAVITARQISRRRHDDTERQIIKHVQKQFPASTIKGSWIQRQTHRYTGEVTVLKNGRNVRHQFNADLNGNNVSIN